MNLKKLFAGALAAATIVGMTGCSSGKSSAPKEDENITATITVWSPQEDQSKDSGKWLQTMCENFNAEHPNWDLTFKYGVCSEGDAGSTIPQDVSAAADVYMFANDQLGTLVDANAIAQLGGETEAEVKANNSQIMIDSVTSGDGIYGVPFTANTWFMYYNKSVFTEEDIKSLDTMITKGKVAFPVSTAWYLGSFFVANGGTLFGDGTDASAGIDFGGEKGYDVTKTLVDLMANKNFVDDANGKGLSGLRDGSIAAYFSGSWDYDSVKKALGDNFGAAQLPTVNINGEAKQLRSFAGSKAIGVNPHAEHPEVAVALARYLGGADAQKAHYEARSIIPCNTTLLEDEKIAADPLIAAQNDTIANTSILQPTITEMNNYWSPTEVFGKAIAGKQVNANNYKEKTDAYAKSLNQ